MLLFHPKIISSWSWLGDHPQAIWFSFFLVGCHFCAKPKPSKEISLCYTHCPVTFSKDTLLASICNNVKYTKFILALGSIPTSIDCNIDEIKHEIQFPCQSTFAFIFHDFILKSTKTPRWLKADYMGHGFAIFFWPMTLLIERRFRMKSFIMVRPPILEKPTTVHW